MPARLTHAGGVVYRMAASGTPEVLLVTAKRNPDDWVLPKGHIEANEQPEQTAEREVHEEAGVIAVVVEPLPDLERTVSGDRQRVRYFLMKLVKDGRPNEGRQSRWLSFDAAADRMTFQDSRLLLQQAAAALEARQG